MTIYVQYSNATNFLSVLFGNETSTASNLELQDGNFLQLQDDNLLGLQEVGYPGLIDYLTIDPLEFYETYFDITTCNAAGLDNYGRILQQPRSIAVPDYASVFGFDTGETPEPIDTGYPQNFDHGSFYGGQTEQVILTDTQYRALLRFRYYCLTTNFTIGSISAIMNTYFMAQDASYKVRVTKTGTMQITYEFNFSLQDYERAIFQDRNILPSPSCVDTIITENVPF